VTAEEKNRVRNAYTQSQERDERDQIKHLLRQAMVPVPPDQLEPPTNLWPRLRARIEAQLDGNHASSTNRALTITDIRVPWFDWALAAVAAAGLFFFPKIIPTLLYHF
jgi:hypothetical protein